MWQASKGGTIVVAIKLSSTTITRANTGRVRLPSADIFRRSYHCCHDHQTRDWLRIQIDACDTQSMPLQSESIEHPLCCSKGWAVAVFHLAIRRALKRLVRRHADFTMADVRIRVLLETFFTNLPEIESYWELASEISEERKRLRAEKATANLRKKAAADFINQRRNFGKKAGGSLPHFLVTLGFTDWPRTAEDIKIAYRRLALEHHPDLPTGDSRKFKHLDEAYNQAILWADSVL